MEKLSKNLAHIEQYQATYILNGYNKDYWSELNTSEIAEVNQRTVIEFLNTLNTGELELEKGDINSMIELLQLPLEIIEER